MTRILLIEDDEAVRASVATMLRTDGHEVAVSESVTEALVALATQRPDAVVLDLVLGVGTERLHEVLSAQSLPVVLISGADPEGLTKISKDRGWRYLAKPFEPASLRRMVGEVLATRATRPTYVPASSPPEKPAPEVATPAPPKAPDVRDPRVEIADLNSRRMLRGLIALLTTALTLYFESRGHTVPTPVIVALSVMALGVEGGIKAAKARPVTAAGGAAAIVGVALLGEAFGVRGLSHLAAVGASGGIPLVTELADRLRG